MKNCNSHPIDPMYDHQSKLDFHGVQVEISSEIGRSGEDMFHYGEISNTKITPQEFLKNLYSSINKQTEKNTAGSCAISAIITPDNKITVANLGDCQATLFVLNGMRLNNIPINRLHNLDSKDEYMRVSKKDIPIDRCIRGDTATLAVSRAFGDENFVKNGLSHEPEFHTVDLSEYDDRRMFLEITSDGSYEDSGVMDHTRMILKKIFSRNVNTAKVINDLARDQGSTDDLTTFIIELFPLKRVTKPVIFSVFDGHGGKETVIDAFLNVFHNPEINSSHFSNNLKLNIVDLQCLMNKIKTENKLNKKECSTSLDNSIDIFASYLPLIMSVGMLSYLFLSEYQEKSLDVSHLQLN